MARPLWLGHVLLVPVNLWAGMSTGVAAANKLIDELGVQCRQGEGPKVFSGICCKRREEVFQARMNPNSACTVPPVVRDAVEHMRADLKFGVASWRGLGCFPRIIHQTWKTALNITGADGENATLGPGSGFNSEAKRREVARDMLSWKRHHPGWVHRLWTDADNLDLVSSAFPWFKPLYDEMDPISRADVMRIFYMWQFGGVYADLDVESLRSIDTLLERHCDSQVLLGSMGFFYSRDHSVPNAVLISKPRAELWLQVLLAMVKRLSCPTRETISVEAATGPVLLRDVLFAESYAEPLGCRPGKRKRPRRDHVPIASHGVQVLRPEVLYPVGWQLEDVLPGAPESNATSRRSHPQSGLISNQSYTSTVWMHSWRQAEQGRLLGTAMAAVRLRAPSPPSVQLPRGFSFALCLYGPVARSIARTWPSTLELLVQPLRDAGATVHVIVENLDTGSNRVDGRVLNSSVVDAIVPYDRISTASQAQLDLLLTSMCSTADPGCTGKAHDRVVRHRYCNAFANPQTGNVYGASSTRNAARQLLMEWHVGDFLSHHAHKYDAAAALSADLQLLYPFSVGDALRASSNKRIVFGTDQNDRYGYTDSFLMGHPRALAAVLLSGLDVWAPRSRRVRDTLTPVDYEGTLKARFEAAAVKRELTPMRFVKIRASGQIGYAVCLLPEGTRARKLIKWQRFVTCTIDGVNFSKPYFKHSSRRRCPLSPHSIWFTRVGASKDSSGQHAQNESVFIASTPSLETMRELASYQPVPLENTTQRTLSRDTEPGDADNSTSARPGRPGVPLFLLTAGSLPVLLLPFSWDNADFAASSALRNAAAECPVHLEHISTKCRRLPGRHCECTFHPGSADEQAAQRLIAPRAFATFSLMYPWVHTSEWPQLHQVSLSVYDVAHDSGQRELPTPTRVQPDANVDGAPVAATLLVELSALEEYDGGGNLLSGICVHGAGCRYGATLRVQQGITMAHEGHIRNTGAPVTKGRRVVLVSHFVWAERPHKPEKPARLRSVGSKMRHDTASHADPLILAISSRMIL